MTQRHGLIGGMLVAALGVAQVSCHKEPSAVSGREQSADTPKGKAMASMSPAEIESRWKSKTAVVNALPKNQTGASLDELVKILRDDCSQSDRDVLLRYAASAPGGSDKTGFPRVAIAGLVLLYVEDGNREPLVRTLAQACPRIVGLRDVEDVVVRQGRKIPDSVIAFFDAFASSKSPEARSAIAGALRRGFAFTGTLPADDAELVTWCRKWYEDHRAGIEFNPEYSFNNNMPQPEQRYRENGLFMPKSK